MKTRVWIVLVVAVAVVIAGMLLHRPAEPPELPPRVRMGYQAHVSHLPLFVAVEKGFFRNEGIEVEPVKFGSANLLLTGLVAGEVDGSAVSSFHALFSLEQRSSGKFRVYMVEVWSRDRLTHAFLTSKDSTVSVLGDLKGKRLGVHPGSTFRAYANVVLSHFLDPDEDLTITQLKPPLQVQALATGQVDALLVMEPMVTAAVEVTDARILMRNPFNEYMFEPFPIAGGVVSNRLVDDQPEVAQKIASAMYRAIDYMAEPSNRSELEQILVSYAPVDERVAAKVDFRKYWKLDQVDREAVQEVADFLHRHGILEERLATSALYYERHDYSGVPEGR